MKTIFRIIAKLWSAIFGLKASVHTDIPGPDDPEQMPAIVPAAPAPIKSKPIRFWPRRRAADLRSELKCTETGFTVLIHCGTRGGYREVTRTIDRISGARKRGVPHRRFVRERSVLVPKCDFPLIRETMGGRTPYHKLRAAA